WIGSTNTFLFDMVGLVAGRLHDRGYFYHLVIGGSLLQAFSLFMLSFAKPGQFYQIFLSQGIGSGIAAGLVFVPSLAVLSHHFDKHLTTVMAIVTSGTSLGGAIHPVMLNNTIHGRLGFANGVRASAGLISGLMLVACFIMRTKISPSNHTSFFVSAKKCMHDSAYLFCVAGATIFAISYCYPQFYLQVDSVSHGLDRTFSFYSLVIFNSSNGIGHLFAGLLANIIGVDIALISSTFGGAVLIFGMIGISTIPGVVVFGVLYGFFSGIVFGLTEPMLTLLTPDLSELGVRLSLPGVMFGPPISGALLTDQYIWYRGAVFNGVSVLST
ncbi:major facilitator superfamily domain-containing protein, partial [Melanogaster broomeanus]